MFKFLRNLFKKKKKPDNVIPFTTNKGIRAISGIKGVDIIHAEEGTYGIAVDMSECPLTPGELIQKLIEGQMDEH